MPASHKREYHNAFEGGYIDHVIRVIEAALEINKVWRQFNVKDTYTTEELVFSALNHDLGKFGDFENQAVLDNTDQWRREKLGEMYMFNQKLTYMSVPDRGIWLLNELGIKMSQNETLSIKLHDGLYDPANEPYLKSWSPETKPRTSLIFIIQQADFLAARIEFESEWLDSFQIPKQDKVKTVVKQSSQEKAIRTIGTKNNAFADMLKNL
jgi:hypothetical protein